MSMFIFGCFFFWDCVILGPYQLVHVKFGISSWRGSRVDGRSCLLSGAIDGSEANRIIRDSKLEFENSRREDVREVFQQCGSGAKRNLSRRGRNQLSNEPILALPEGADDFVVYYDAQSKDLEAIVGKKKERINVNEMVEVARWNGSYSEYVSSKYQLGKEMLDVLYRWSKKEGVKPE
ncbi:hypothetical protein Tco_0686924 [Tanacetum coccineum]